MKISLLGAQKKPVKRLLTGYILWGCGLYSACTESSPSLNAETPQASQTSPVAYQTAFEACAQPPAGLMSQEGGAAPQLYRIEAEWVDAGGRSQNWICHYFEPETAKAYAYQGDELILAETLTPAPEPLALSGVLDSDVLLRHLWSRTDLDFPVYRARLEGQEWEVSSAGHVLLLEAQTGANLG